MISYILNNQSLNHVDELLQCFDGLSQSGQLGNHLVVVAAQPASITQQLLSDCISSRACSSSPMSTHFSGSKLYSCRLKSGIDIFFEVGWTENGSLSRWFCMVETWQSILGQRKDSMIYSQMKVSLCTFDQGSLPIAQSPMVLAHSNLRISSAIMLSMHSTLLFLLFVHSSFTLSLNFSCLLPMILSMSSMHLACSNTFCSIMISMKCLLRIQMLLSTCALAYCFRQNLFTYQRLSLPLSFIFQALLFSTQDTTFSANKDSALTLPVTNSKQSTSPFLTESFSSLARLSQTQMCKPRPPENTNMSWLKPKSQESAFSMTSTAVISSFQHLTQTLLPEQQVRTSSQSFMSKSKISSLSKVLPFVSFSGTLFQIAPASTFIGMVEWRSIILFFMAFASTKVTYLSTPAPSYSKESSLCASCVLWFWVSHLTMVLKGQRQLQQTLSSYSAIWRETIIINEPNHTKSNISGHNQLSNQG